MRRPPDAPIGYADKEKISKAECMCWYCFNDDDVPTSKKMHFTVPISKWGPSPERDRCLNCGERLKVK